MAELDDLIDRLIGDLRGIVGLREKMKTATAAAAIPPPPPAPAGAPDESDIARAKQVIADIEGNIKALKEKIEEHEKKDQAALGGMGSSPQQTAAPTNKTKSDR
jgi:hypothetical protein